MAKDPADRQQSAVEFGRELQAARRAEGIEAGKLNLWTYDHYHASTHGSYLEALVVFGSLTGRDPRSLGENECSAYELGLSRQQAKALQQVAFDQLGSAVTVVASPGAGPASRARCASAR